MDNSRFPNKTREARSAYQAPTNNRPEMWSMNSRPMGQNGPMEPQAAPMNTQTGPNGSTNPTGPTEPGVSPRPLPTASALNQSVVSGDSFVNQFAEREQKRKTVSLMKTIAIIALTLSTVTFVGLFVWALMKYNEVNTDVEGRISLAVAEAERAQSAKDEDEFAEREKDPYYTFSGPVDYGEISFEYPKTWSVYIAADAANGGDYKSYFNPREVNEISNTNINALRFIILDTPYESAISAYENAVKRKENPMTVETITLPDGTAANRYTGTIPGTEFNGYVVIFKVRDKTAIFQTDSANNFRDDFNRLIQSIKFNA